MSFLNLALLGGALALAIPIIIHLFHKSRFQVVRWGAMHLLTNVVRTNQRRIRIEQLILLAIRCAIPALLALAMARPIWQGAQRLLGDAKTSTVILLDNSYSMEASRAGISNFRLARDEAGRVLGELKRGSDAAVVLLGEGGGSLLDEPTYDLARLTQALGKLDAGFGSAVAPAGFDAAAHLFGQMRESQRQLIMLTDFQRVSFEATEDKLLGQTIERLKKLPIEPQITLFDVGTEIKDNVAVESLDFSRLMVGVGQKIQIRANLRNYGEAAYPELRVYFKVDGKERSVSQVRLAPHEKGQVLFTHTFDEPGSHVVEVVADADALTADNRYLASIPVRDKLPVLLVNGDPSAEALRGETDFAEIALQPFSAGGKVELADLISPKVIRPEELRASALTGQSVVILANVRKLENETVRALEEFVKAGGGLLVFPGNRSEMGWYNGALFSGGKGLLPQAFGALTGEAREGAPAAAILAGRYDNPALELFNDPRNGSLADSAIKVWFKLAAQSDAIGAEVTTLARLENGDGFLLEKPFGEGRVIQCATALDADWSNLPMRPFYVPLLQRLTVYLASTVYPPRNLEVSRPMVALLANEDAGKRVSLLTPDGRTLELEVTRKGQRGVVEFAQTQQPGLYTLTLPKGETLHYVVNASRRESDLQRLSDKEINDLAASHGVAVVRSSAEFKALDQLRRFGRELWKPVLALLLGLSFLELILQQRFARGRAKS